LRLCNDAVKLSGDAGLMAETERACSDTTGREVMLVGKRHLSGGDACREETLVGK
jgi:hypothetical protein